MLPQIHFNFGPTALDRFYQLSLPLVPGGVFSGGVLMARPDLGLLLGSVFKFNPYAGVAAFVFAAYVLGFVFLSLSGLLTGIVSAATQSLAFRSWTPARPSYSLSQCRIWRQVAAEFLGKLAPALPENPRPASLVEKALRPMKEAGDRLKHDELWEEWYRILQDYLLRDTPLVSNDIMFVWLAAQATAGAVLALCFVDPHVRHWWVYVPAGTLILFGTFLPFLITFSYLASERLSYWDFTARLLAEVRGREIQKGVVSEPAHTEVKNG